MAGGRKLEVFIIGNASSLLGALAQSNAAAKGFQARMAGTAAGMAAFGKKMTTHVSLPLVAIGVVATEMAEDFERSMTRIETQAGAPRGEIKKLHEEVLGLSKDPAVTQGPKDLAEALFFVESGGFRGKKAMEVLKAAAHGATVSGKDLNEISKALTATLQKQGGSTMSASQVMGILNATVGQGIMEFSDLTGALSTGVLPAARNVGLGLEDVGGALATLTRQGIPAQVAATRLGMVFLKLIPTGKKAQAAFDKLGIGVNELGKAMRKDGLPAAIDKLKAGFEKLKDQKGPEEAVRTFTEAFPRGLARTLFALMDFDKDLRKTVDNITKKSGEFAGAVKQSSEDAAVAEENMKARIQTAMIKLGEALEPIELEFIDFFAMLADKFNSLDEHTRKMIVMGLAIVAAIGPVVMIGGALLGMITSLIPVFALLATPIGAVVAALVLLGAAMVAAKVAPQQFEAVLRRLGFSAEEAASIVKGFAKAFDIIAPIIKQAAQNVRTSMQIIIDIIQLVADVIRGDWADAWKELKSIVSRWLGGIVDTVKTLLGPLVPALKTIAGNAALAFLEPFSKLPKGAGQWARDTKEEIEKWMDPKGWKLKQMMARVGGDALDGMSKVIEAKKIKGDKILDPQVAHVLEEKMGEGVQKVKTGAGKIVTALDNKRPEVRRAAQRVGTQLLAIAGGLDGLSAIIGTKVATEIQAGLQAGVTGAGKAMKGSGPFQFTRHEIGEPMAEATKDGVAKGLRGLATVIAKGLGQEAKEAKKFGAEAEALGEKYGQSLVTSVVKGMRSTSETPAQELRRKVHEAVKVDAAMDTLSKQYGAKIVRNVAAGLKESGNLTAEELRKALKEGFLKTSDLDALTKRFGSKIMHQVVAGMRETTPSVKSEAIAKAKEIIQAMNQAVVAARDNFKSAFGNVISAALSAFDEMASNWKPPHLKMLEAMDLQEQKDGLRQAITDAGNELAAVQQEMAKKVAEGGTLTDEDKQKVLDAQKRLDDALMAQKRFDYGEMAKQEQEEHDADMERRRTRLEARLNKIMQHYASEKELSKAEIRQMNKEIRDAMGEAGIDSQTAGQAISNQLALGIRSAINEVTKAVNELARVLKKRLKLRSNAEEGELSDIESWWVTLGPMLAKQIDPEPVKRAANTVGLALKGGIKTPTEDVIKKWDEFGTTKDEVIANLKLLQTTALASKDPINEGVVTPVSALRGFAKEARNMIGELRGELKLLHGSHAEAFIDIFRTEHVNVITTFTQGQNPVPGGDIPGYQHGGVVPGPFGKARLIIAHGGERITPAHSPKSVEYYDGMGGGGQPIVINVNGSLIHEREMIELVRRALLRNGMQNGRLGLV